MVIKFSDFVFEDFQTSVLFQEKVVVKYFEAFSLTFPFIQVESGIKLRIFIPFHAPSESPVLNRVAPIIAVAEWKTDLWRLPPLVLRKKLNVKGFINVSLFEQLLTSFDITKAQFILNGLCYIHFSGFFSNKIHISSTSE